MNWIVLEEKERIVSNADSNPTTSIQNQEESFEKKNEEPFPRFLLDLRKSQHIQNVLKKTEPGEILQAVYPGNGRGKIEIVGWEDDKAIVEYEFHELYRQKKFFHLYTPLPRPQTGKKILHLAGAFGISEILFYSPSSKNKEYFTSPVYRGESWKEFCLSGVEQTGSMTQTNVKIISRDIQEKDIFKPNPHQYPQKQEAQPHPESSYSREDTITRENFYWIFHPKSENSLFSLAESHGRQKLINYHLFLGSESGYKPDELKHIENICQAKPVHLGNDVLRTEYALSSILFVLKNK